MTLAIAVFASGGGTNLQALLDHFAGSDSGAARIALVISDRAGAGALERARAAGVDARVIPVVGRDEGEVAEEMVEVLGAAGIDLVVLAGYLRLMPPRVVREYRGRMLNIHPALLPAFGGRGMYGARIHRAVLDAGCTVTGVTVHFVDERYDTGPILLQWPVPVLPGDSVETLAKRVLDVEHLVLPAAVDALVETLIPGAGGEGGAGKDVVSGAAVTREAAPVRFGLVEERGPTEVEVRRLLEIEAERVDGED